LVMLQSVSFQVLGLAAFSLAIIDTCKTMKNKLNQFVCG
jgi:hypothetical protein